MIVDKKLFNPDMERSIISLIIFENDLYDNVAEILNSSDFFVSSYSNIFSIMGELREKGRPLDESFILPQLLKIDKNAETTIIEVLSSIPVSNYEPYLETIRNFSQLRKLSNLSLEIQKIIEYRDDSQQAIAEVSEKLNYIEETSKTASNSRHMEEITSEILSDMEKARSGESIPFFRTGYVNFDSYIGGFVEEGLTVIAARPSMGKSAFMSSPIMDTIASGDATVLYSMEVIDKKALSRLISFRSQEPLSSLKMGTVSNRESFTESMNFYTSSNDNFSIVDKSGMSRKDLEIDIIKRVKANPNLKSIFIDHLLQMRLDEKKHAPTELGDITKMLKRVSQNYKLTIILLSQLNRSVESRDNKRPMMSDLQGSGSIEQDADMIIFLYRPEYYKEKEHDSEKDGQYIRPEVEHAEVLIGKNRDGPTGSVELGFKAKTASFINDYIPSEVVEYIDDTIDAEYTEEPTRTETNVDSKAYTKENTDIINNTEEGGSVQMPLI